MTEWLADALSFFRAVVGVLLRHAVDRSAKRRDDNQKLLRKAIKALNRVQISYQGVLDKKKYKHRREKLLRKARVRVADAYALHRPQPEQLKEYLDHKNWSLEDVRKVRDILCELYHSQRKRTPSDVDR
ncbi:hypothetical protein [Acidothermus cellulolyticus]|jgi:hypothetical protein|uniref:hypothetical protein n=1 Tax=Acidothermus cellulolyticus TaxID=28049 RepID=UPI0011D0748B|nr:hypothetical protein [Acidothermus cellulolyticus]